MTRTRMTPAERKTQLLLSAVELAKECGYKKVTRVAIAADTGTSEGLVNRYFGDKEQLRAAILQYARAKRIVRQVTL